MVCGALALAPAMASQPAAAAGFFGLFGSEDRPPAPTATEGMLAKRIYLGDRQGVVDRLRLALAAARVRAENDAAALSEAGNLLRLTAYALKWEKPVFPLKGGDLTAVGATPGPKLGAVLKNLEAEWVASNFTLDRDTLLQRAAKALAE